MSVGAVNKQTGDRIPTAGMPAIDNALDLTSVNPVQNAVITAALAGKQNTLTFDDVPTENSNNPVKSNGIYDALSDKANTDIVASDFDATASYTAGNYCIYEGKFYKFKNNHTGAWSASDVDEIKIAGELAAKQNVTDNSLNTTDKTVPGAINELKSGLTNLVKTYTAENVTFSANGNTAPTTLPITNKVLCVLIDADATSRIVGSVYKAVADDVDVYGLHAYRATSSQDVFTGTANVTVYYI